MEFYDEDGCYCLLIAILTGVGANSARLIYQYGPDHPAYRQLVKVQHTSPKRQKVGKERRKEMKEMREKGCSIEMLAAVFDCDSSTVRRNLKKAEDETYDDI